MSTDISRKGKGKGFSLAKSESRFMLQVITATVRMATIEWISQMQLSEGSPKKRIFVTAIRRALERYFHLKEIAPHKEFTGKHWLMEERGDVPHVKNDRVRAYYTRALLGKGIESVRIHMLKSLEMMSGDIKNLRGMYSDEDELLILSFIAEFGMDRINEVADSNLGEHHIEDTLTPPNPVNRKYVAETVKKHKAAHKKYVEKYGADVHSPKTIEELIHTDPDLRCTYQVVLKRIESALGKELESQLAIDRLRRKRRGKAG